MKKLILLLAIVLPAISQASNKDIAYSCVDIETGKKIELTIVGNGSTIYFWGNIQKRISSTPNDQLDGRPAYSYQGSNYSGVTLPEEIMKGQSARGRIYQVGYDFSSNYDCVLQSK